MEFAAVGSEDADELVVERDGPVGLSMQEVVVVRAEQVSVREGRFATVFPVLMMMNLGPRGRYFATGPSAVCVASNDCGAQRG